MKPLSDMLKCFCLMAAIFLLFEAGMAFMELRSQLRVIAQNVAATTAEVHGAVAEIRAAAQITRDYTQRQTEILSSSKNQKALESGWQSAAVLHKTLELVNSKTLPRINKTLDSLEVVTQSLNTLVHNTDQQINAQLLPETTASITQTTAAIKALQDSVVLTQQQSNQILVEIQRLISDPSWKHTLEDVASTTARIDALVINLEAASKEAPSIAASLEKLAATSSKYQKALIFANILSLIGRAF